MLPFGDVAPARAGGFPGSAGGFPMLALPYVSMFSSLHTICRSYVLPVVPKKCGDAETLTELEERGETIATL